MLFPHSSQTWPAAETSSVRFRLITRVRAGTSTSKCRFGRRDTEPHCMSCLFSDRLSFSSRPVWQDQFLLCSFQQRVDSVTCIVIMHYYTQVYCSPCSHTQLEYLSPVQITNYSLICCFAHLLIAGRSPFAVGHLIANPEDSSFSINTRCGSSDRAHRHADPAEQFSPAAALLVSFTEM